MDWFELYGKMCNVYSILIMLLFQVSLCVVNTCPFTISSLGFLLLLFMYGTVYCSMSDQQLHCSHFRSGSLTLMCKTLAWSIINPFLNLFIPDFCLHHSDRLQD